MKAKKGMFHISRKSLIAVLIVLGISLATTCFAQTLSAQSKTKKRSAYFLYGDADGMYLQALQFDPFAPMASSGRSSSSRVVEEGASSVLNPFLPFNSTLGRRPAIRLPFRPPLRSPFQP